VGLGSGWEEEKERRGERSRSNFDLIGDSELIINFSGVERGPWFGLIGFA
jgi:hypothetical protein